MAKKIKSELNGKDVLTEEELSARWGGEVLPHTLAQWRSMKMGPKYVRLGDKKRGRRIVYRLEAIEEYERENEIKPNGINSKGKN